MRSLPRRTTTTSARAKALTTNRTSATRERATSLVVGATRSSESRIGTGYTRSTSAAARNRSQITRSDRQITRGGATRDVGVKGRRTIVGGREVDDVEQSTRLASTLVDQARLCTERASVEERGRRRMNSDYMQTRNDVVGRARADKRLNDDKVSAQCASIALHIDDQI